jgi:hypothetical protein
MNSNDLLDEPAYEVSLEDTPVRRETLVPEKHLDSPVIVTLLERLQLIMEKVYERNHNIRETQLDPRRSNCVHLFLKGDPLDSYSNIRPSLMQYSNALDFCLKKPEILTAEKYPFMYSLYDKAAYRLRSDMRLATSLFEDEVDEYMRWISDLAAPEQTAMIKNKLMSNLNIPREDVVLSGKRAQLWSTIIDDYRRLYKKHNRIVKRQYGPLRVVLCDGFMLIKHDDLHLWQLATFEQVQMIQDCCLARHNVMLALQFSFHNGSDDLRYHVNDILKWQELVLTSLGNKGFELVKAPEAIFKTHLNSLTEGDLLTYSSYNRTLDKMREKEKSLHHGTELIEKLDRIVKRVTSIYDAAELFGLAKLSGHPSVYAEKSADSVRKEAEPRGVIQPFAVRQMTRMFKHLTLSGYIRVHTSWPPFLCPPARNTELRRHHMNNVTTLPMGSYPLSDLDAIQFDKFVEYDYSEDYLKFLDDKAICPGASEMSKFWFDGERKEARRLLQKILTMKHFDTVAMVERLRKGNFTEDEYVVELTQKERELKIAARCFCKLPFEVRTFFTSTEYNLKEQFMSKYMPQQTMTMSNTETKTRLYNLVRTAKSRDRTLLEVDFSRWNLRWRHETVHPISSQLEDIFGLPGVFSQAHPFFEKSTIVMTDKHSLPLGANPSLPITQWPISSLVWRGTHLGGFEGIQQALWTACTIAMMYWVLHDQNLSFNMAGQGDNQIFAITFTDDGTPTPDRLRRLLALMEVRCALLNHEVKPDECIDSQTVLTYSKDIYVEGVHILYNLKFASRSFRRDEIDIPSLTGEIAGISAVSMACADSIYETFRAVHWKTLHTLRFLSNRYESKFHTMEQPHLHRILSDPKLCKFILRTPGSIGGLPIMQWTRFFMKGEVDDLSWDMPSILRNSDRVSHWDLKFMQRGDYTPKNPNMNQLILDPHSLPLDRPRDRKRLIKDAISNQMLDHTQNVWIREIFSEAGKTTDEELMTALTTARPFYPEIMSDIYSLSPSGVKDALLARFTMTRTVAGMTGNQKFVHAIQAGNAQLLRFIIGRYDKALLMKGLPSLPRSSYDNCVALRKLWGPDVHHKNIGVYNPLDYPLQFFDPNASMISASARCHDHVTLADSTGPYPPNFGTKTKQKVSDHGFKIVTSSSTVQDLKRLILTYSELGGDPAFGKLITQITRARSPWTADQLLHVMPTSYGGTAAHRHAAINAAAFSILGSRTVPTHINFCSDISGLLAGGEFDYPFAFQEFYLVLTNVFQNLNHLGALSSNAAIGFKLDDNYEALPTDVVKCDPVKHIAWTILPHNALCYVGKLQAREIPAIPQPSQIPHVDASSLKPSELVYNRLLGKYASRRRLFTSTSSVNLPVEVIDMKEFAHCPLGELLTGTAYFITAMAVYVSVLEFKQNASVVLNESIMKISRGCSALLGRMMLHPSFSGSKYAVSNGILCDPGSSGARQAADSLAGDLIERVRLSILAREFVSKDVPFVLFADFASTAALPVEIHCTLKMAMSSFDPYKLLLSTRQLLALRTARNSLVSQVNTLFRILSIASATDAVLKFAKVKGSVNVNTPVKLRFVNAVPEEAIRSLRTLPLDYRLSLTDSVNNIAILSRTNSVRVDFEYCDVEGSLSPHHQCVQTSPRDRMKDQILSLLQRPYHGRSSAMSVWMPILSKHRQLIRGKSCMSIGVGHGAIAASCLNLSATQVYGVDLRSSFPAITQRELTYKPAEVIRSARSEAFSWSRFVSMTGGDVIKDHTQFSSAESVNTLLIDIEQDLDLMWPFFQSLPNGKTVILRVITCHENLRLIIDCFRPDFVYSTSSVEAHKSSYILVMKKLQLFNPRGNYERVKLISIPHWQRLCEKSVKYTLESITDWLRPTGQTIKIVSIDELRQVLTRLRRDGLNANDNIYSKDLLTVCADIERMIGILNLVPRLSFSELAKLSIPARRVTCCWIANMGFDLSTELDLLRVV